ARLDIRSSPKAERYMTWSQRDWKTTWNAQGARLAGPDITLRDSTLTAVSHGISAEGARARIIGNEIRGFSGDGIRGLSTGGLYQSNLIRDCVKVDGNHDDGFQAWVAEPGRWGPRALRNVRFEGNRIFEWTGPRDHTFRCSLQGIALFRGPFDNWTIANNLVVVSAYHGLTLYGGRKCKVVNNTVISADLRGGRSPWIRQGGLRADVPRDPNFQLAPGDRSQDNLFANNVATALRLGEGVRNPLALNTVSKQPLRDFEDPANFDFRPRADSRLLGAADPRFAPARDLFGTKRPQGGGPDLGAVER
ncbi:MAG: right-handed parallel beta-helix repeat-containing protein, partial [Mangrovicoccus sp.]|nr:right-handed parallel beta-helix repeat-containing protein [Mangrovicoccus sp.]